MPWQPPPNLGDAFHPSAEAGTIHPSLSVWKFLERAFYIASIISLFSGLIIILNHLTYDPAVLGAKLGASLVTPFYGVLLALASRILCARVENIQKARF